MMPTHLTHLLLCLFFQRYAPTMFLYEKILERFNSQSVALHHRFLLRRLNGYIVRQLVS